MTDHSGIAYDIFVGLSVAAIIIAITFFARKFKKFSERKELNKVDKEARRLQAIKRREQEIIERAQLTLNMYCIGVGKAGVHLLDAMYALDTKTLVNQIYPLALPSSRYDYQLADNIIKRKQYIFPFGASNRDVRYTGAGGDQHLGQQIAIEDGRRILEKMYEDISFIEGKIPLKAIVLIGSLAGGTGGGAIPALAKMIKDNFPDQLLIVLGFLPEKKEGKVFLGNASRSFNMIMKLRDELSKYIDTIFILENMILARRGMLESYDFMNEEFAKAFNLLFGSTYSPYPLGPDDKTSILKAGGKKGIGMMCYTEKELNNPNPQTDMEIEDSKSEIIRKLKKNLSTYPSGTVGTGSCGAYQIRCNQSIFPLNLMSLLNTTFENQIETGVPEKHAFVKGGIWPAPGSTKVEIATTVLGIDLAKYDYISKLGRMWKLLYDEEEFMKDFEQIRTMQIMI